MAGIHHLFPPEELENLPTWRFRLHFVVTAAWHYGLLPQAIANLLTAEWKIIEFSQGIENINLNDSGEVLTVAIEVTENRRQRSGAREDYESDVWKVIGNVMSDGLGDIYYEAVDWQE
ncbi:MAG: hypothetical protein KDA96_05830 [Planctomycetaceae bacterium]|nr:hypothetical protein [Planctomycetaceae bacterium]MCA9062554.1 hypothetical protein [Planctomycetaceae bacterium]